MAKIIPAS